jgi:hypothetical protein
VVLRLMTNSNLVGACTGNSTGFAPRGDAIYVLGRPRHAGLAVGRRVG